MLSTNDINLIISILNNDNSPANINPNEFEEKSKLFLSEWNLMNDSNLKKTIDNIEKFIIENDNASIGNILNNRKFINDTTEIKLMISKNNEIIKSLIETFQTSLDNISLLIKKNTISESSFSNDIIKYENLKRKYFNFIQIKENITSFYQNEITDSLSVLGNRSDMLAVHALILDISEYNKNENKKNLSDEVNTTADYLKKNISMLKNTFKKIDPIVNLNDFLNEINKEFIDIYNYTIEKRDQNILLSDRNSLVFKDRNKILSNLNMGGEKIYIFNDNSILLSRNGTLYPIIDKRDIKNYFSTILKNEIVDISKIDHEIFNNAILKDYSNYKEIIQSAYLYENNKSIFKLNNCDIRDFSNDNLFEEIKYFLKEHDFNNFKNTILKNNSNDTRLVDILKEIYNFSDSDLNNKILNNINNYVHPVFIERYLIESLNEFTNFTKENFIEKAKDCGINIIPTKNNKLIIEIKNHKSAKIFGNSNWNIVEDESKFQNDKSLSYYHYFIIDFNKHYNENESKQCLVIDKKNSNHRYYPFGSSNSELIINKIYNSELKSISLKKPSLKMKI